MRSCQRGALPPSFITLQVNKTIFYNTTGNLNNATDNLNNERMFLFSTTFFGLLLSGPPCYIRNIIGSVDALYCFPCLQFGGLQKLIF